MQVFIFFLALWLQPATHADTIWLRIGQVHSLKASPNATVRIGKRGILRVVEAGSYLKIIALKPGETALSVDDEAHVVRVSESYIKNFHRDLESKVRKMMGLKVRFQNGEPAIYGTLLRFSDWLNLAEVAREDGGHYSFSAHALEDVAEEALRHFQKLAKARGLPLLRLSLDPNFTVHIPFGDKDLSEVAEEILGPFGIQVKTSKSDLSIKPLIRTEVVLAEVSRSKGRLFGVEWPASYEAQVLPKLGVTQGLMVTLKALEAEGQAQILASPNLLCRSGGEARFHAGGEFPIRMISRLSKDVLWKKHGVVLNVKPKADFSGAMSLEVETEVSLLDHANAVDGIPALKTNRVQSHFDLPGRRTIALSGLLRQELGSSNEGLPLLKEIPVLGALFSSRNFQARESELVIFVTPEVYTPDADAPLEMPKGWIRHDW